MARLNEPPLLSSSAAAASSSHTQTATSTQSATTGTAANGTTAAAPPPSSESFEALKRRFIRQNRDLARTNSSQSLRIRNLETEISRLLSENVALREQAINLEHELEKRVRSAGVIEEVKRLKMVLEGKVLELSRVLGDEGLGGLVQGGRKKVDLYGTKEERERETNFIRLQQREWRLQQQAQDTARLPPITEDRKWPRRTLSGEGLLTATSRVSNGTDLADSPDLGPPPVAQFDTVIQTDPIKFDRSPGSTASAIGTQLQEQDQETEASAMLNMTSNLERRRRRRVSSLLEDMAAASDEQAAPTQSPSKSAIDHSQPEIISTSKQNAKTTESKSKAPPPPASTKRSTTTSSAITSRIAKENQVLEAKLKALSVSDKESKMDGSASERDVSTRKPLGTKSANSPSKPRRTTNSTMSDKVISLKEEIAKTAQIKEQQRRDRRAKPTRFEPDDDRELQESREKQCLPAPVASTQQPKTPAPSSLDLFSPSLSTDPDDPPSTARSTTQTSEMASTTASVEDVVSSSSTASSSAAGRGSRRARPTISYAEPNLRDKMRRPGKQLVDAVIVENNNNNKLHRDGSAMKREGFVESQKAVGSEHNGPEMRIVTIKNEKPDHQHESNAWKNLPKATGEHDEAAEGKPKSPLVGKTGRSGPSRPRAPPPATASHVSGIAANADNDEIDAAAGARSALTKLSIYDGPSSSPPTTTTADATRKENDSSAPARPPSRSKIITAEASRSRDKSLRRHSTTHISSSATAANPGVLPSTASSRRALDPSSSSSNNNNNEVDGGGEGKSKTRQLHEKGLVAKQQQSSTTTTGMTTTTASTSRKRRFVDDYSEETTGSSRGHESLVVNGGETGMAAVADKKAAAASAGVRVGPGGGATAAVNNRRRSMML